MAAPARAPRVGLRPGRGAGDRRPDPREVPRHPAGARLPGLPRPHREAHCSSTCSGARRTSGIPLTESFAMHPGGVGVRLLLRAPGGALLRGRQDRPRPGRGLPPAQGHGPARRSSAGWRRISATSPPTPEPPRRSRLRARPGRTTIRAGPRPFPKETWMRRSVLVSSLLSLSLGFGITAFAGENWIGTWKVNAAKSTPGTAPFASRPSSSR